MVEAATAEMPLARCDVLPVVGPHLDLFADVLATAWGTFRAVNDRSQIPMAQATSGARAMLVADFMRDPAHRCFRSVPGVAVDDRYGRPWVNLASGRVQVRFKKLTATLAICSDDTERQTLLAFHLGDPYLPGMPEATILTAGYVLDDAQECIEQLALVCHIGAEVYYSIKLPGGASTGWSATQLPLAPLSPPIIRSARSAALERLALHTARQ